MTVELKVPLVGESITEVQIGDWLKSSGELVAADEPVVVIETDKVTVELPAPVAGRITGVLKHKGDKAQVGEVIGHIEPAAAGAVPAKAPAIAPAVREKLVMPAAARELAQRGASASDVKATGPGGRVLKEDVVRHAAQAPAQAATPSATASRAEEVVPMTPLRKKIAERLVQAQRTAAILTTFNEVDMSAVIALRKAHQERFVAKHGVKLGFVSFFVKAAIAALEEFPQVNAEIRGDQIAYRNYFDIGIAVGGGKGLVVPILRNAERLGFAEIELAIADFASRAKDNQLALDEITGGTFTISNGGTYGSLLSTPILNPPQSGILGLHAIQERAVVRGGAIVARPMMYVALSYDHRIVDGREAVTFLVRIKECVEDPARMLIEI